MTLNWRHKSGLFFTVVAVGIGLFLECSAKQAVGIALLGIAFAWLIGTLPTRALVATFAILLCAVGLYVGAAPVLSDRDSAQKSAAEYDVAIADLQSAVKGAVTIDIDPSTVRPLSKGDASAKSAVDHDALAKKYGGTTVTRLVDSGGSIDFSDLGGKKVEPTPLPPGATIVRFLTIPDTTRNWIRPEKQVEADWNPSFPVTMSDAEIMKDLEAKLLLPRPTFHLGSAVRAHIWNAIGGLVLFVSGLSILGWSFRRTEQFGRAASTAVGN
jgi:hypothetical protein